MSMQTATKTKCVTCGHIVGKPKVRLSSIEFRRYVNSITDLNTLIESKDYLTRFIRSEYKVKEFADKFLNDLETMIDSPPDNDIDCIRIWILGFINDQDGEEMGLYKFLQSEYHASGINAEHHTSGINETFNEFYQNYAGNVHNPMNKNRVSRALSALGLKTEMKKVMRDEKPKCTIIIYASNDELTKIFRKNGMS